MNDSLTPAASSVTLRGPMLSFVEGPEDAESDPKFRWYADGLLIVRDGRIQRGDLLLLEAFGGGFTWGSALLRY